MNIRTLIATASFLMIIFAASAQAQRVQIVLGNPGCGPVVYSARPVYTRPVFINPVPYCGPTQLVVVRPTRTVYLSSRPVVASGFPVLSPPIRHGVYRAPIVPVNAVQCGNGFTWRR